MGKRSQSIGWIRRHDRRVVAGRPCGHPGCVAYTDDPCPGCGRIGGQGTKRAVRFRVCWDCRVPGTQLVTCADGRVRCTRCKRRCEERGESLP